MPKPVYCWVRLLCVLLGQRKRMPNQKVHWIAGATSDLLRSTMRDHGEDTAESELLAW